MHVCAVLNSTFIIFEASHSSSGSGHRMKLHRFRLAKYRRQHQSFEFLLLVSPFEGFEGREVWKNCLASGFTSVFPAGHALRPR